MKNKWMLAFFAVMAVILMAATIPTTSSFLGDKVKGIGVEVTSGGDVKLIPKDTVGKVYIYNDVVYSGAITATTASYAGAVTAAGNLAVSGTTTLSTTLTGILKAASGVISAATANVDYPTVAKWNELRAYMADGLLVHGTLLISAVPEKFKTTTTAVYTLSGVTYTKAATDNLTFTAAHTVNNAGAAGQYYGIILLQINAAGTISTKVPAADQVYTSSALAIAALPTADALNTSLGYILIYTKEATAWVANTGDMTDGSDVATATFSNTVVKSLPAAL